MQVKNLLFAAIFATVFRGVSPAQSCSVNQLVGTWGFTISGWDLLEGQSTPAAETMLSAISITSDGKVTGAGTSILGAPFSGIPAGQPLDWEIVDGSVQLNSDCTGFFKYSILLKGLGVPAYGPNVDRIVFAPGSGVLGMRIRSPLSKPLEVYTMHRISFRPTAVQWAAPPAQ